MTTPGNYSSTVACADTAGEPATPVDVAPHGAVPVGADQVVVCTYTNTRLTGSIELVKDFVGTPEAVTLNIGTSAGGGEVDSAVLTGDGTTEPKNGDTGTYYVSESMNTPGDYPATA